MAALEDAPVLTPAAFASQQVDFNNLILRQVDIATATTITVAGNFNDAGSADGAGTSATFNRPVGVAFSPNGTFAVIVSTLYLPSVFCINSTSSRSSYNSSRAIYPIRFAWSRVSQPELRCLHPRRLRVLL